MKPGDKVRVRYCFSDDTDGVVLADPEHGWVRVAQPGPFDSLIDVICAVNMVDVVEDWRRPR